MKLGPMFKWFGSKWQAAKNYPVPKYGSIYEFYAGGAGYSLNFSSHAVTIYDSNSNLIELWKWLINDATEGLIREIPIGVPEGTDIRTLGLTDGQASLLKHWQRTNSVGNCWTISPWGNKPGQWTDSTRSRVSEQVSGIKHWQFRVLRETVRSHTIFVDPPYLYNYRYGVKGEFDYGSLAKKVVRLAKYNQLIVCEARHPETGLAPNWLPFRESHRSVTSRRKPNQSHHSRELIWCG